MMFITKIIRNGFILSGLYFMSVVAVGDLNWTICKPILVFFGTYVFTELARFYNLTPKTKKKNKVGALIW